MYMSKRSVNIILDLVIHIVITLEISLIVYLKFQNILYVLMAVAGGILIDIDHMFDFIIQFRRLSFRRLLNFPYQKSKHIYLFFHSWELVIIAGLFSFFSHFLALQIFVFSWGLHLFVDNIDEAKKKRFLHYFLIYRFSKGFKTDKLKGFIFDNN